MQCVLFSMPQVSLEFAPSSAVPGEETTMKITADSQALCGVSAIDQSVLIKEPGKTLDAEKVNARVNYKSINLSIYALHLHQLKQRKRSCKNNKHLAAKNSELFFFQIFDLLPVRKVNYIPYETQDDYQCLHVRPRRYIMPYPEDRDDPHTVFQVPHQKIIDNISVNSNCH